MDGQVDISPFEFTLWALLMLGLGVLLGFPMGGLVALKRFVPVHLLGDEAEAYVRKVTEL